MTIHAHFPPSRPKNAPEAFNGLGCDYDSAFQRPVDLAENNFTFNRLRPMIDGRRVVDLGCGTGLVLEYCQPAHYVGVDISEAMLISAKRKSPGNVFLRRDMENTGLPSQEYQTAVSTFGSISYCFNPGRVVDEIERVLLPGGLFAVMAFGHAYAKRQHHIVAGQLAYFTYSPSDLRHLFGRFDKVQVVSFSRLDHLPALMELDSRLLGALTPDAFYFHLVTGRKL